MVDKREADSLKLWAERVRKADRLTLRALLKQLANRPTDTIVDTLEVLVPASDLQAVMVKCSTAVFKGDSTSRQVVVEQSRICPEQKQSLSFWAVCGMCAAGGAAASLVVAN